VNRFTAAYLADRVGAVFAGRINGVTRFGLFVTLDETGADGLVPMRTLPADTYIHDAAGHCLRGRRTGREYRPGGMIFHLMDSGAPRPGRARPRPPAAARKRRPAAAPKKPGKKGKRRR
jgi:ribonuclease R